MFDVFLTFFLLASGITANKGLLYSIPPSLFVSLRMLIPGLATFLYLCFRKKIHFKTIPRDALLILGCTLLTTFIPSNLKAYALKNLISSKQSFLGSLEPFFAALYGYLIFGEKITGRKTIGLLFGFTGAMILIATTTPIEESIGTLGIFSYPELAMITAVALGRFGWTLVQKILKEERYSPTEFNSFLMIGSGILSLLTSLFLNEINTVQIKEPLQFAALFSYTILIGNMLGYNLYAHALKRYSTTFIALAGFSVPIWVHIFGYFFHGEPLSGYFFAAVATTLFGLLIFSSGEIKK